MLKELVATVLLSGSIGLKYSVPVTVPFHDLTRSAVDYDRSPTIVQGIYNFRDYFGFTDFNSSMIELGYDDYIHEICAIDHISYEGQPADRYICPLSYGNKTYFLYNLEFEFYPSDYLEVNFYCYSAPNVLDLNFSFYLNDDYYLSSHYSLEIKELMFNLHEDVGLSPFISKCFNFLFTKADNSFVTTYSGYFTWSNLTSYNRPISAFGTSLFGSSMYYDLVTPYQGGATSWSQLYVFSCNFTDYSFVFFEPNYFDLPLQNYNKNWLVTWKLSNTSRSNLELYGVFQYVPDHTYDDVTFKDFFFSIVDTPVYFVSSILSFELFGVNLFIALSGLLTLCCILLLIKKFW